MSSTEEIRVRGRFSACHPAVLGAARRAGLDVETFLLLVETERQWPAARRAPGCRSSR